MQTHAISDSRRAQAARKGPGANRPTGKKAHDGVRFGASLADFPILPAEAAGSSSDLRRLAAGHAPSSVPASVREVLRQPGRSLPADVRSDMEERLGCDFSDVRLHTDEDAGRSADAVAAHAYAVGRHIVFAAGRFDPGSAAGRRLLVHELAHAAGHRSGAAPPGGKLRISTPGETAERHAVAVAEGALAPAAMTAITPPALYRQEAPVVKLTGLKVNHDRVTVPPPAGHGLKAIIEPANATGVVLELVGNNATIASGTTINSATGAITIDSKQDGGSANVKATQASTSTVGVKQFNFTAVPGKIIATSASARGVTGFYGGNFVHTFDPPKAGASALERAHINEKFAGASGTMLTITGKLGTFKIEINDPNLATKGWDLDSSGAMSTPDRVTWDIVTPDARPFVVNASNASPANTLPQELTATQSFRNLDFPGKTYGTTVDTTTHRRAIEDRSGKLKAVTSANAAGISKEVVETYAGPTVFRNAKATPASIPAKAPTPPGGSAPAATTSTITVGAEGAAATPAFSIDAPDLGCTIDAATGVLTPGTTAGTVTVRAGDSRNFDETMVTVTAPPAPTPPTNP